MKFYIYTAGCKANQWDSYIISERLRHAGLIPSLLSDTDVVVINACTVTDNAERDIRRFVNHVRQTNKNVKIILTGCHAQVYSDKDCDADLVLGNYEKFHVEQWLHHRGRYVSPLQTNFLEEHCSDGLPTNKTRFFFKIQDGCNQFCTYCIVPYARGGPRSRSIQDIVQVLSTLKEKGVQEVVLTGIELSLYMDTATGHDLTDLLHALEQSDTPQRIRLSSINPLYINDRFITAVAQSHKIAKHIHISLQSGSDRILESMGRKYTRTMVDDSIHKLQTGITDVAIGVDVIAGFPTEDDAAFMETYRFLEKSPIYYMHIFPFSPRQGTVASTMTPAVPESVKRKRVQMLRQLDGLKRKAFCMRFMNRRVKILPEAKKYNTVLMRGYTDNYIPVTIPFTKNLINKFTEVAIKELQGTVLVGTVIEPSRAVSNFI